MKKLREAVIKETSNEVIRANAKFPLFRSKHEGVAVIEEEVLEAADEMAAVFDGLDALKEGVYQDLGDNYDMAAIHELEQAATEGACELIQVAAMARKFRMSQSEESPKEVMTEDEYYDRLAEVEEACDAEVLRVTIRLLEETLKKIEGGKE